MWYVVEEVAVEPAQDRDCMSMSKPLKGQASVIVMAAAWECPLHPRHLITSLSVLGTCIYL